jgi:AbiV family abortive infection protein
MKKKNFSISNINNSLMLEFQLALFSNAKRLIFESHQNFLQKQFSTSVFLSISSIEEMGKYYLCRVLAIRSKNEKLSQKDITNLQKHFSKQLNSFLPPFSFEKEEKISKNISHFWELVADNKLMCIRNNCLYVDIDLKNLKILSPGSLIREQDAQYFLKTAYEICLLQIKSSIKSLDCEIFYQINLNKEISDLQDKLGQLRN